MMTKMFTVGMLSTNCYVTSCKETRDAIIIDPGFDDQLAAEKIIKFINENALELKFIINTHGHPDHTCGNGIIKEKFHVSILIHEDDAYMLEELNKKAARFFGSNSFSPPADTLLHDGNLVKFGKITLKVMHTPGHTYGSISLLGEKEVFTGDTLFAGSIGRTDLPGSSERDMRLSLEKLTSLPNHYVVYPGHGSTTTLGEEKLNNPFL
ncbi:MBL fold metallo-hydrolase [Candidatus Bathyarchaeota archaeon CG07_land_8_20_14_0_80_47_9]|nr:MAG: MBL fold metallo-hydrolase [Candidatus Bathyarchaeota archaeon CG07_land_8_20_14_0_80_47_9]